jgi:long-subunit fatty acid transport protein
VLDSNGIAAHLLGQTVDIGRIEVQKHWRDTVAFHLGGDYRVLPDRLTLRAGASYQSATAQSSYANIDFVGGAQLAGSLGASVFFGKLEVSAAYQYLTQLPVTTEEQDARVYQTTPGSPCLAPYTSASTCNAHYLGQTAPAANAGSYHAYTQIASLGAAYRF